jgi:hypothetical protein
MMLEVIRLPYSVPYAAQVASPELARAIFVEGLDPQKDPRWAESGAKDPAEYAYWTDRACGVVCVKMCVEALGGENLPFVDWARRGLARQGYLVEQDGAGKPVERGWLHKALAQLIEDAGFQARALALEAADFPAHLRAGRMIIASACYQLGDRIPVTRKGGHLVVVVGANLEDGRLAEVVIHNPSGRLAELRENALIPVERFLQAYTGRAILVER